MARVSFSASQQKRLDEGFLRSAIIGSTETPQEHVAGQAWTGLGSSVALLTSVETQSSLHRLSLSAGARANPWTERVTLERGLPQALLTSLVAPPLAGRTCTALIATDQAKLYPHPESRTPSRDTRIWSPSRNQETIRAAAQSPSGDLYFAAAPDGDSLRVWDSELNCIAEFDRIRAEPDKGVGLAVQGRGGDATVYAWSNGVIAWRKVIGKTADVENHHRLPEIHAPPQTWRRRFDGPEVTTNAWYGWREAKAGAYPMMLGEAPNLKFGALLLGAGLPSIVRYADGRPQMVASGSSSVLFADQFGLKSIHTRNGAQLAYRQEVVSPSSIFVGLSSGHFLSLSKRSMELVMLAGWTIRAPEIVKAFEVELRVPRSDNIADRTRAQLDFRAQLPPLEIDDGIAIALEQGVGGLREIRLWCEYDHFLAGADAR